MISIGFIFTKFSLLLWMATFISFCNLNSDLQSNVKPDTPAVYEGEYDMGWVISHYMIYPKSEIDKNRKGIVDVSWTVNKEGIVENVKVTISKEEKPSETAIARRLIKDQEVLKLNQAVIGNLIYAIKLLKFKPAMKDGEVIQSKLSTSVAFILVK